MSGANRPRKSDPSGWTFDQLISIAVEAQWISVLPDQDGRYDYVVAGLLTGLRRLRNYVHPGRHAQDKPLEVLTAAEMDDASAAYDSLVLSLQIGESEWRNCATGSGAPCETSSSPSGTTSKPRRAGRSPFVS